MSEGMQHSTGRHRRHGRFAMPIPIGFPRRELFALVCLCTVGLFALGPSTAFAKTVHKHISSFGSAGSGSGQFTENSGLAVDEATGNVYVADTGNHRIEKFDAEGNFLTAFGSAQLNTPVYVAVDNSAGPSAGDVYVADTAAKTVLKFDSSGNLLATNDGSASSSGPFETPVGIAVGSNGNLWVYDLSAHMHEFEQDGTFVTAWEGEFGAEPGGIAVDSGDNLYMPVFGGFLVKFDASGTLVGVPDECVCNSAPAIDPVNGDIYSLHGGASVVQRDANGVTLSEFGSGALTAARGIALNSATGTTYVSDAGASVVAVFREVVLPDAVTGPASAVTKHSATLSGSIDPDGGPPASCQFEWGSSASLGNTLPCAPAGPFSGPESVSADLTGLEGGANYYYRVSSTNAEGTTNGQIRGFAAAAAFADVATDPATDVGLDSATLHGHVNPGGQAVTTCRFAYGDAFNRSVPCSSDPGAGSSSVEVDADIAGLEPGRAYQFRLIVSNTDGTTRGRVRIFTTQSVPISEENCPNEQVRQQQGATDLPMCMAYELVSPADQLGADLDFGAGSIDGNHAWIASTIPLSGEAHTGNISSLVATRTSNGWTQTELSDPSNPGNNSFQLQARAADSSASLVLSCPGVLTGCSEYIRFERVAADGTRTNALEVKPVFITSTLPAAATSEDLSTVVFATDLSHAPLLAEDTHTKGKSLYLSRDGALEFIGVDQSGDPVECGAGMGVQGSAGIGAGFEQSGLSADGSVVVYRAPDPQIAGQPGCSQPVDVYVRSGGTSHNASAPRNGNPDEGAEFVGASRDGEITYFITKSQLVPEDDNELADLYAYNLQTDSVAPITIGADVELAAVAPNAEFIYFRANKAIDGQGTDGTQSLYVYHAATIRHIATRTSGRFIVGGTMSNNERLSPITPDGLSILFRSGSELTNQPLNGTEQLFKYEFSDDSLVCVSCGAAGSALLGSTTFPAPTPAGNDNQRFQSDDGRTVAFQTSNRLLPQDVNDQFDVYLWHDGKLSLISSGRSERHSLLLSIDAAGRNVFFTTSSRLTPDTEQDNTKLYNARVNGGFLVGQGVPPCTGAPCHLTSPAPATPSPGSATTAWPGNQVQRHRHKQVHRRHHKHRRKHGHRRTHENRSANHKHGGAK